MIERYENHPRLDISGTWNSEGGLIRLWFPVVELDPDQRKALLDRHRERNMVERANKWVDSTTVELIEVEEPTATEEHTPLITPSELYLEEPTGGVMLIEGRFDFPHGERVMETCALIAADVYADFMFEKDEQQAA